MPVKQHAQEIDGEVRRLTIPVVNSTVAVRKVQIPVLVPESQDLVAYVLLGGLAVVEIIEWPIALVAGLGIATVSSTLRWRQSFIAGRGARSAREQS